VTAPSFGVAWSPDDVADIALAEDLGFASAWVGEHLVHPTVPTVDALVTLANLGARTTRLQLGTGVLLLPLRHPVAVAKAAATVDALTDGRLILGVGVGGEYPTEFEAVGVPVAERGQRTDEALAVLRRLWSDAPAPSDGVFWRVPAFTLTPRPVRPGGPPVWVGGRSPAAVRRAAAFGNGFMPLFVDPAGYGRRMTALTEAAERHNRDPETIVRALFQFVCVDRGDRARRRTIDQLGSYYQQDFTDLVDRYCVMGTAAQCVERLGHYIDEGAQYVVLVPVGATDRPARLAQVEVFGQQIIPCFGSAGEPAAELADGGTSV